MTEEDMQDWAAHIITREARKALEEMDTGEAVDHVAGGEMWSDEIVGQIADLIDTAICTITVDWQEV